MIKLKDVSKTYKTGTKALHHCDLHIGKSEFVYIIGPTGSGKSTLIKLLDGEEVPTSGSVEVAGVNVGKLKHRKVPVYRRNIGVVFQDFRLLEARTVFENIAYALEVVDTKPKVIRKRVREVMNLVGLDDKGKSFPNQLSGGQQQRVAIARAIANKPKVLIADEPTGNLDPKMSNEIINLLEKINREEETTVLVVTHDEAIVDKHVKRTIILEDGHVVADLANGGYRTHD